MGREGIRGGLYESGENKATEQERQYDDKRLRNKINCGWFFRPSRDLNRRDYALIMTRSRCVGSIGRCGLSSLRQKVVVREKHEGAAV